MNNRHTYRSWALLVVVLLVAVGYSCAKTPQVYVMQPAPSATLPGPDAWLQMSVLGDTPLATVIATVEGQNVELDAFIESPTQHYYYGVMQGLSLGTHELQIVAADIAGTKTVATYAFTIVEPFDPELINLARRLEKRDHVAQAEFDAGLQNGSFWQRWVTESKRVGVEAFGMQPPIIPLAYAALANDKPDGFFAAGVKAYEVVRERPYFTQYALPAGVRVPVGTPETLYGPSKYNPQREIPGWHDFLTHFSNHPAADDAAYRLGRSYELQDLLLPAAGAFLKATRLPDEDMHGDAILRLLYLIDVAMSAAELQQLSKGDDPSLVDLVWSARYAAGLRLARHGFYAQAAAELSAVAQGLAQQAAGQDTAFLGFQPYFEPNEVAENRTALLPARIKSQSNLLLELATLSAQMQQGDVGARYDLAARIYHNPLVFYNHMWGGLRNTFWSYSYVYEAELSPQGKQSLTNFLQENNYAWQAYTRFQAMADDAAVPEPWREKALFSAGMSLYRLALYGAETYLWQTPLNLAQQMTATFQRFVQRYPDSALADDALLMAGVYGRDKAVLQELVKRYPAGDKAAKAADILANWDEQVLNGSDPLLSRLATQPDPL